MTMKLCLHVYFTHNREMQEKVQYLYIVGKGEGGGGRGAGGKIPWPGYHHYHL